MTLGYDYVMTTSVEYVVFYLYMLCFKQSAKYSIYFFRRANVNEWLSILEQEGFFDNASLAIDPPVDGNESAEDSGDDVAPSVDNLAPQQLIAEASVTITRNGERHEVLVDDDDSNPDPVAIVEDVASAEVPPPKRRRANPKQQEATTWVKQDLTTAETDRFKWNGPAETDAYSGLDYSPEKIFELFFDDDVCDLIVRETLRYASEKGDHDFRFDLSKLKIFLGILLLSGYNTRPRRHQYWSTQLDLACEAVSRAMPRNTFDAIMKYLHLADNTNLNKEDKFSKVSINVPEI